MIKTTRARHLPTGGIFSKFDQATSGEIESEARQLELELDWLSDWLTEWLTGWVTGWLDSDADLSMEILPGQCRPVYFLILDIPFETLLCFIVNPDSLRSTLIFFSKGKYYVQKWEWPLKCTAGAVSRWSCKALGYYAIEYVITFWGICSIPILIKKNITLIYECLLKKQPLGCTAEAVSSWLLQRPCANATEAAFKIWAKNPHHFKKPHTHVWVCRLRRRPLGCAIAEAVSSWLLQSPCASNATEAAAHPRQKSPRDMGQKTGGRSSPEGCETASLQYLLYTTSMYYSRGSHTHK